MNALKSIKKRKLVAVIRGARSEEIIPIAESLYEGGIDILEITAETQGFLTVIERLNEKFGDKLVVGAGTVLDPETARVSIMSGAQFIFSPIVDVETIRMAKRYNIVSIPGAMTPTEILTAHEAGADIVKVFPANVLGPKHIKAIHGPLPNVSLMPTGGVTLDNIKDFFSHGAVAVGLGGALVNASKPLSDTALKDITNKALQFRHSVSFG